MVVCWIMLPLVIPASHIEAGSCPDSSTSAPTCCKCTWEDSRRWSKSLGPCYPCRSVGKSSWLQPGPGLALKTIWRVNQQIRVSPSFPLSPYLCLSKKLIFKNSTEFLVIIPGQRWDSIVPDVPRSSDNVSHT